ncbi:MAG: amidohydrolase family protein [Candidatus Latescibacteria bacterium]|nr:amidohydrolase family protein [Candidatus Latescibacterota bacterium]
MLPIVDTHHHLWDLERFELPWLDSAPTLANNYLMDDYRQATQDHHVAKTVYMEVDVAPHQQNAEVAYITELCGDAANPMAGAVIGGHPDAEGFADYIRSHADNPFVKGVRQVLHVPEAAPGHCLQPDFVGGVRLLGELGLSFDLCFRPAELGDAIQLADHCPTTQFIVDHCGNGDPQIIAGLTKPDQDSPFAHQAQQWRDDMAALGQRPNVVCKISGIIARVDPANWSPDTLAPTIDHCLNSFGAERVVFGGDWPVCTLGAPLGDWIGALRQIIANRPETEQRALLHDNAARLYRLT